MQATKVECYEVPGLPDTESPQVVWQELVELLGKGGASSRAIAERLHRWKTKDSSDLTEVEEEQKSATLAEKQLKVQLKDTEAQVKEMSRRLSKETTDKEKAISAQRELKEQVKQLQLDLEDAVKGRRSPTNFVDDGNPTSLSGKKKMLQKKAFALMGDKPRSPPRL